MSSILSLISGKGGSGKTTLAICIASMLSDCGKRVLLIDCDLSTNGATYFYENKLKRVENSIICFTDLLNDMSNKENRVIDNSVYSNAIFKKSNINAMQNELLEKLFMVNDSFAFIPSALPRNLKIVNNDSIILREDLWKFSHVIDYLKERFDYIIFDCQAGYSNVLEVVLPVSDYSLIVMEADAISSASVRNLYLKASELLSNTKVYQVFSKVSEEEKKIYAKVTGGTIFTNIESVVFDWRVRNAFALAEVPDLKDVSSEFGKQVYNICCRVFSGEDIRMDLKKYELILTRNSYVEQIDKNKPTSNTIIDRILTYISLFSGGLTIFVVLYELSSNTFSSYEERHINMVMMLIMGMLLLLLFTILRHNNRDTRKAYYNAKKMLMDFDYKHPEIAQLSQENRE